MVMALLTTLLPARCCLKANSAFRKICIVFEHVDGFLLVLNNIYMRCSVDFVDKLLDVPSTLCTAMYRVWYCCCRKTLKPLTVCCLGLLLNLSRHCGTEGPAAREAAWAGVLGRCVAAAAGARDSHHDRYITSI